MYQRPVEHFLKTVLYDRLEEVGFLKRDPKALIYKDMEELEKICNKVLDNGEVDVVYSTHPLQPPEKVRAVKVVYDTNDMGFAIPESCKFQLLF